MISLSIIPQESVAPRSLEVDDIWKSNYFETLEFRFLHKDNAGIKIDIYVYIY